VAATGSQLSAANRGLTTRTIGQPGTPEQTPELAPELAHVVNAFDPWARERGEYYSLER
jgi:hypothetical protein